tara:strand:+ start:451 stop:627 length:177 start_codon:yes stop_codon:yes gene_type:complete
MFYVVSKDQVNGEFSVQIVDNEDEASDVVGVNRKNYIDSVAMSKDDLMLLTSVANNIN